MHLRHLLVLFVAFAGPAAAQTAPSPGELWRIEGEASGIEIAWVTDVVSQEDAGILWLLDEASNRLIRWRWPDTSEPPVRPEVVPGDGLRTPVLLATDAAGRLAVLDVLEHTVVHFSADGRVRETTALSGPKLRFPKDLLFTPEGRFIILAGGQEPDLLRVDPASATVLERLPSPASFPAMGSNFMTRTDRAEGPSFTFDWFFSRPTALMRTDDDRLLHVVTDFAGGCSVWSLTSADATDWDWETWTMPRPLKPLLIRDGVILAMERDPASGSQALTALSWQDLRRADGGGSSPRCLEVG